MKKYSRILDFSLLVPSLLCVMAMIGCSEQGEPGDYSARQDTQIIEYEEEEKAISLFLSSEPASKSAKLELINKAQPGSVPSFDFEGDDWWGYLDIDLRLSGGELD